MLFILLYKLNTIVPIQIKIQEFFLFNTDFILSFTCIRNIRMLTTVFI